MASQTPRTFTIHVALIPEQEGGFSGIVLNLPGAASQCETRTETLDNVADAVLAVIESYALWESGTVPWTDDFDVPVDATEIVVLNLTEASWVEVSSAVAGVSR